MEGKFRRKLAAIIFTDIVGYTHLMHINEERALKLRSRHREVLQALHDKYGGEVLQFFGDGTLSIFQSSVNAVECAVEMQIEYRKDPEVPVRIGIHVGDISYDGNDAFGDGLNVAARIEPVCEPGGVFVSERVFEDIRNHAWLQAMHVGNFQLKNLEGTMPLYAITSKGMSLPTTREPQWPPQVSTRAPKKLCAASRLLQSAHADGWQKETRGGGPCPDARCIRGASLLPRKTVFGDCQLRPVLPLFLHHSDGRRIPVFHHPGHHRHGGSRAFICDAPKRV